MIKVRILKSVMQSGVNRSPSARSFYWSGIGFLVVLMTMNSGQTDSGSFRPLADVHLHYNWDQAETLDAEDALTRLRENGIVLGVVSSRPPALALELSDAAGDWVIPFYMPYLEPQRKRDWFFDHRVLPEAREALASGRYKGIGELHLIVGFAPALSKPQPVVDGLLELAVEFAVPLSMHVEASSPRYFEPLCRRHPEARIMWAHAGGVLPPSAVDTLLEACPNVWLELSARDQLRYGGAHPIVDEQGKLLPAWEQLVLKHHRRIMVGSDPFYREGDLHWDEPNTGWDHLDTFIDFHRTWLSFLPGEVADRIMLQNALAFFRIE